MKKVRDSKGKDTSYFFSRTFFMDIFRRDAEEVLGFPNQFEGSDGPYKLNTVESFFDASRILKPAREVIDGRIVHGPGRLRIFEIADREIHCVDYSHGYMDDPKLRKKYSGFFKEGSNGASYLEMSRFIMSVSQIRDDKTLAEFMLGMIMGKYKSSIHCPVAPLLLAVTLVAEPHRNPSCFLPSLILFDLIRRGVETHVGGPYRFIDSLQNPDLAEPLEDRSWYDVFAHQYRLPTGCDLKAEQVSKVALREGEHSANITKIEEEQSRRQKELDFIVSKFQDLFDDGADACESSLANNIRSVVEEVRSVNFDCRVGKLPKKLDFSNLVSELDALINELPESNANEVVQRCIDSVKRYSTNLKGGYNKLKHKNETKFNEFKKKQPGYYLCPDESVSTYYNLPKKGEWSSTFLMNSGGWFPMSSRLSYLELNKKRKTGQETMSDIKSFCIISDWLQMLGYAKILHSHEMQYHTGQIFDQSVSVVQSFMRFVQEKIVDYLKGDLEVSGVIHLTPELSDQVAKESDRVRRNLDCKPSLDELIDPRTLEDTLENEPKFEQSVVQNGLNLQYVPPRFQSSELFWKAVRENGMALQFVEEKARSPGLCVLAVNQNPAAEEFVPREEKTNLIKLLSQESDAEEEHTLLGENNDDSPRSVVGGSLSCNV
ncbi:MAG: DUF4116 domain-containing protein [Pseudomonadota bacterium]|nr:DUF4116 domain-containing protein [Pseudomonadota bacterium]